MDKNKKIVEILTYLVRKNSTPSMKTLDLDLQEYGDITDSMLDDGLIEGSKLIRDGHGKVLFSFSEVYKIRTNGIEYLKHNS
jgi:hypothetical protein